MEEARLDFRALCSGSWNIGNAGGEERLILDELARAKALFALQDEMMLAVRRR